MVKCGGGRSTSDTMGSDGADLRTSHVRFKNHLPQEKRHHILSKGNMKVVKERQKDDADEERRNQCAEGKSGGHGHDTITNPPSDPQQSQTKI